MSKRGFLDLDDDNFWGNDDSKADVTSEQEEREGETTSCDLGKDAENGSDEPQEDTEGASKADLDGWEDVGEMKKSQDAKIESGKCIFV
ncbi:unnamed protein product [Cylicostephanus goldi]|uniref:Uncharacterized protein n=1 Tax=Cylicostephanus goldi TaxID=71465 RepID=A0A3P6UL94_CYLGO|nr:unnamed protein product [Cylicostephanus goldi]